VQANGTNAIDCTKPDKRASADTDTFMSQVALRFVGRQHRRFSAARPFGVDRRYSSNQIFSKEPTDFDSFGNISPWGSQYKLHKERMILTI
jgi:hypothetical protein